MRGLDDGTLKFLSAFLLFWLVGCTYDPTEGTLRYSVSSDAFTRVDNIYYDDESGGHNTGPIALPFELSLHVVGEKVGGNTNQAWLKVFISSTMNSSGGNLTTKASYLTEYQTDNGAKEDWNDVTKRYEPGTDISQNVFAQTWRPGL